MLTLKFQRMGKKKQAHFRLIIQEKSKNPKSNALEILGWYNPVSKNKDLKSERIKYWLEKGAVATATVHNFLVSTGLIKEEKVKNVKISKKRKTKIEADKKAVADKIAAESAVKAETEKTVATATEEAQSTEATAEPNAEIGAE